MCYLGCQKIIEGSIFRGRDSIQNLLSDLDLGGPDDLRYDLRGRLRPLEAKIGFFALTLKLPINRCSQPSATRFSTILSPQEYVVSEYVCQ